MPLIVISGYPSSGKSTRAKQLAKFFEEKGKKIKIISENHAISKAEFKKNDFFADSLKEKQVRSDLKAEVLRLLSNDEIIIFDAGNYIKGYRYEIFCASKSIRGTQCTLFCAIQKERAWKFNKNKNLNETNISEIEKLEDNSDVAYTEEIFNALCLRYEEPHGNCRWDSPLFVSFPDDQLDFEGINSALFESNPLQANKSTENPPLSSSNFLFELDKQTHEIINNIIAGRKIGISGSVPIKGTDVKAKIPESINAIQLNRLRKQFITYTKQHDYTNYTPDKVPTLFVHFLNSNFNK